MADILPEPVEENPEAPVFNTVEPEKAQSPLTKRTIYIFVSLVIFAALCLAAAYTYDFLHNRNQDNTRKQDLSYIAGVLNDNYDLDHSYPTLGQLNSSTFGAFAPSLNHDKFKDPSASSTKIVASPSSSNYAYEASPKGCNDTTSTCSGYKLIAILSDSKYYTVSSPKH